MREKSSSAAEIAALAARQHGCISRWQILELGLSSSSIQRWVETGHLHLLHRGVYAAGHANVSREGRYLAAVLACGEGAALSHTASARHLNLDRTRAVGAVHVSIPSGAKRQPPGIIVHRPRSLPASDIVTLNRIPTTTATRTLFDLTSMLSAKELRKRFERAEYLEALDRGRLRELLDGASGRRGLGSLRTLANYAPLPLSRIRTRIEGIILSTCRTHSLPIPAVNVPVLGYEVDFFWPEARFVVEADGGLHKGEQRDSDNARDITLARAGYLVRRYSEEALNDERAIAAEIVDILGERLPARR